MRTDHCTVWSDPPSQAECDTRSIFKQCLTGLNSEFSFSKTGCHTKAKEPHLPNYLPIAGETIVGIVLFLKIFALSKIQTALCRI